jgi:hypothetical protein
LWAGSREEQAGTPSMYVTVQTHCSTQHLFIPEKKKKEMKQKKTCKRKVNCRSSFVNGWHVNLLNSIPLYPRIGCIPTKKTSTNIFCSLTVLLSQIKGTPSVLNYKINSFCYVPRHNTMYLEKLKQLII